VRAFAIAWKDVRHVYRSFSGLAMMLIAPLLLAGAIGAAFGSGNNFSISVVKTVVVNQDAGAAAAGTGAASSAAGGGAGTAIVSALTSPQLADLLSITQVATPEAAKSAVDTGGAEVAVIIPAGLTQALTSAPASPLSSTYTPPLQVEIYKDPTVSVGPAIVGAVVQELVQSLNGARAAASAGAQLTLMQGVTDPGKLTAVATQAAREYSAQAQAAGRIALDSRSPVTPGGNASKRPNTAGQVLIGMMLFFTLFGAATPARSIIDEQRQGTLPRLFTTSTPRTVVLWGKYMAVFLVVLLQSIILLTAGRLIFGSHWGAIGPVAVLVIAGALVASSLGLLTVSFAKTPAQAGAGGAGIFVFLGLISGSFTGSTDIGGAYAVVRHFSPLGWLLDGWNHTMFGGSWGGIVLPVLAALGFAVVFFAVATFFFRRRYA
jgi:ABC-2 type transport system permease protein